MMSLQAYHCADLCAAGKPLRLRAAVSCRPCRPSAGMLRQQQKQQRSVRLAVAHRQAVCGTTTTEVGSASVGSPVCCSDPNHTAPAAALQAIVRTQRLARGPFKSGHYRYCCCRYTTGVRCTRHVVSFFRRDPDVDILQRMQRSPSSGSTCPGNLSTCKAERCLRAVFNCCRGGVAFVRTSFGPCFALARGSGRRGSKRLQRRRGLLVSSALELGHASW